MAKKRLILAQLGTPATPKVSDVRAFLARFLGNPRVVGLPRFWWQLFLRLFLLPFYAPKSAKLYERLWDGEMFLSKRKTYELAQRLQTHLNETHEIETFYSCVKKVKGYTIKDSCEALILFPQYCESTHGVLKEELNSIYKNLKVHPSFHLDEFYLKACGQRIDEGLAKARAQGIWIQKLILSFHNMPLKQIRVWDDPYLSQCQETYKVLKVRVKEIESRDVHIAFQSRFGKGRWAKPETREMVLELIKKGDKQIAIFCPGFLVDGIETVDEIGLRLREEVEALGGQLVFIPCLNDMDEFVEGLASYLLK